MFKTSATAKLGLDEAFSRIAEEEALNYDEED